MWNWDIEEGGEVHNLIQHSSAPPVWLFGSALKILNKIKMTHCTAATTTTQLQQLIIEQIFEPFKKGIRLFAYSTFAI